MDKIFTKDNIVIAVAVVAMIIQSNYFATKLDVSNLRNEMLQMKSEMQQYSDKKDDEILSKLEMQYEKIMSKLEKMR